MLLAANLEVLVASRLTMPASDSDDTLVPPNAIHRHDVLSCTGTPEFGSAPNQ